MHGQTNIRKELFNITADDARKLLLCCQQIHCSIEYDM